MRAARHSRTAAPVGFSRSHRAELLQRADAVLQAPPACPRTERHPGRGVVVARFVLPLDVARPLNRDRHAPGWKMARDREQMLELMRVQWFSSGGNLHTQPLPGRPMARCVRFSSVEPDATAAWWKLAVDVLLPARKRGVRLVPGLGIIEDDRPSKLETRSWWERAPARSGFALIEIWTGEQT